MSPVRPPSHVRREIRVWRGLLSGETRRRRDLADGVFNLDPVRPLIVQILAEPYLRTTARDEARGALGVQHVGGHRRGLERAPRLSSEELILLTPLPIRVK